MAGTGQGVEAVWDTVLAHRAHLETTGALAERRGRRLSDELRAIVARRLEERAIGVAAGSTFERLHGEVLARRLDPYSAADTLLCEMST